MARSVRAGGHHGVVWRVCPTGGPHRLLLLLLLGADVFVWICMRFCLCVDVCRRSCYQKALAGMPYQFELVDKVWALKAEP